MRLAPRTLGGRLSWAVLGPTCLLIAGLIALAFFAARDALESEVGARLEDVAATAASSLSSGLVARFQPDKTRTHRNLLARLQKVVEQTGARRLRLTMLDGRSMVDTSPDAPEVFAPDRDLDQDRFELERAGRGETASSVLYEDLDGVRFKRGFAPVVHEGEVVAVVVVEGSARTYAGLDSLGAYMGGLGAVALVALAAVLLAFGRAITAPLSRLVETARRIGEGKMEAPVDVGGPEEISLLARTMDEMRDALLRRDREMQMMLGGIAHEVRNPLGGMELFVGLLKEDLAASPELSEELSMLERVDTELHNLARIVEEFLAYARRTPIVKAPVDLRDLVFELATLVDTPVVTTFDGNPTVMAEHGQLRRVLLNLVRNAAQAGAMKVELGYDTDVIHIRDDGPGVPVEAAVQVFDAFYTTREKGTGLGLALCLKIVQAHGGDLELLNPGQPGAHFAMRLPG